MKKIFCLWLFVSIYLFAGDGQQQLHDLIDMALKNNHAVNIARLQLEGSRTQAKSAYSGFMPSLNMSMSKGLNKTSQPDFYTSGLTFSQTVFDGARSWYAARSVENRIDVSEISLQDKKEQVIYSVKSAFYSYLRARELTEVAQLSLELAESQLELVQQQFELHAVSETDLLKAKVREGQARAQILQSELTDRTSLNALNIAIGETAGNPLNIGIPPVELQPIPTFETAKNAVLSQNAQLKTARYQEEGTRIAWKTQTGVFFPTVSVSTSYSAAVSGLGDLFDGYTSVSPTTGINISFPIFSGLSRVSRYDELKYSMLVSQTVISQTEDNLLAELDNVLTQLETYRRLIPIDEEIVMSAESDYKLAEEKYNLGASDVLDLLDAKVSLIQAKSDLIRLKYDAKISESKLEVLMGSVTQN